MSFIINWLKSNSSSSSSSSSVGAAALAVDEAVPKLISFSASNLSVPVVVAASSSSSSPSSSKPYDRLFKFLLIGESGSGKSSLLKRFTNDSFSSSYCSTIGVDFACRTLSFAEEIVKLQIWDTSGQERFRTITSSYYRGAHGVLLVYSQNDRNSFEQLGRWLEEIRKFCSDTVAVMVVCQKSDLPLVVEHHEGKAWAEQNGFLFAVTSAKLGEGVFEAFCALAQGTCSALQGTQGVSATDKVVKSTVSPPNVLRVNLSELGLENRYVATGEPIRCAGCGCFFSVLSQLCDVPSSSKKVLEVAPPIHASLVQPDRGAPRRVRTYWNCEMCDFANGIDESVTNEELAEQQCSNTIDFVVRPPLVAAAETAKQERVHMFVIDCSGSMNASVPVQKVPSRVLEKRRQEFQGLVPDGFGAGGGGGGSFVSRLELLQSVVERNIRDLFSTEGGRARVGIIAFASDVTVYSGDDEPLVIAGDLLSDFDTLRASDRFRVKERSLEAVLRDLYSLKEGGQTALGPALTVAVNNLEFGSTVTLATDGLANVGVGRMDEPALMADANQVYIEAGESCRLRGVVCNVYALAATVDKKKTNMGLNYLCNVADYSGGTVTKQESLSLNIAKEAEVPIAKEALVMGKKQKKEEIRLLLSSHSLAVLLPRCLRFDNEMDDEQEGRHWLVKDVGVVKSQSNATFGFCWKEASSASRVPFQVQTVWTKSDGSQIVRVAVATLGLSGASEQSANIQVELQRAAQLLERLVKSGHCERAREELALTKKRVGAAHFAPFSSLEHLLSVNNNNDEDAVIAEFANLKVQVSKIKK